MARAHKRLCGGHARRSKCHCYQWHDGDFYGLKNLIDKNMDEKLKKALADYRGAQAWFRWAKNPLAGSEPPHVLHEDFEHAKTFLAEYAAGLLGDPPQYVGQPPLKQQQERMAWVYDTGKGFKVVGYSSAAIAHLSHGTLLFPSVAQH
jgi:hypothetical protein